MKVAFKAMGPIIGLTGNFGSGKTLLAELLQDAGIAVIDFETQVNLIRQQRFVEQALLERFGTIEVKRIRVMVQGNSADKAFLATTVAIPALQKTMVDTNRLFMSGAKVVIWNSSLLLETGSHENLKGVILITAPEDLRLQRILAKDPSYTPEELSVVLNQQWAEADKIKTVRSCPRGIIIPNEGSIQDLREQIPGVLDFIYSVLG